MGKPVAVPVHAVPEAEMAVWAPEDIPPLPPDAEVPYRAVGAIPDVAVWLGGACFVIGTYGMWGVYAAVLAAGFALVALGLLYARAGL